MCRKALNYSTIYDFYCGVIDFGDNIYFCCLQGRTALHWLCNNGYLDAIKLLLGFDAFPNHMENSEERYCSSECIIL